MPAAKIRSSIERTLGISPSGVRRLLRYDVEGLTERQMRDSVESVFPSLIRTGCFTMCA